MCDPPPALACPFLVKHVHFSFGTVSMRMSDYELDEIKVYASGVWINEKGSRAHKGDGGVSSRRKRGLLEEGPSIGEIRKAG